MIYQPNELLSTPTPSSTNHTAYYSSPYSNYVLTNYDTPTSNNSYSPNTYSPVPNSSPAGLLSTPSQNAQTYAAYMTPTTTNTNSPASVSNTSSTHHHHQDYATPLHYTNLIAYSSPYPLMQIPAPQQHSPIQTTYLIDANNSSNYENYNNNNNNMNKENQKPNRGNRNGNKKYKNYNNNNNSKVSSKRINYHSNNNQNENCGDYIEQQQQQQQPQMQEQQQVYYHTEYIDSSPQPPQGYYYEQQIANESYIPCNDITNYSASPVPPAQNGQQQQQYNDYYQIDNNNCCEYQHDQMTQAQMMIDSAEEEKLACKICRGKKKCFCYFIKVGYHKFPSYVDFAEYQFRQWKSNMQKPNRRV
jgi:hypothetical protein